MSDERNTLPLRRRSVLATAAVGLSTAASGCSADDGGANDPNAGDATTDDDGAPEGVDEETGNDGETDNDAEMEGDEETTDEENADDDEETKESVDADIVVSSQHRAERITIDRVETEVDARLQVVDDDGDALTPEVVVDADDALEEYTVQYTEPIDVHQTVTVRLVADDAVVATASAIVRPDLVELERGEVQFVEAVPDRRFEYPYFAYVPEKIGSSGPVYVEPNNTGISTDDFGEHRREAESLAGSDTWRRQIPADLGLPFLVPVFPRPRSDPVDLHHYVHALDAETMAIEDGPLERVDRQLIEMVDHYRASLDMSFGYDAPEEFHMNGFSASGTFVNRFAALHPERVRAATAGGVNGTLILPRERANGRSLPYPIGVDDVAELTGDEFDEAAWTEVPQFLYLGAEDENDTIPYDDAWNSRLRDIALDVYGEDMQNDRMPYCESVYEDAGANAQIHVYGHVDHAIPRWIRRDLYEFHRRHADGGDFDPIDVRDAPAVGISFAEPPRGGDTEIAVRFAVPDGYLLGGKFSDGSVSVMLDSGEEIDWRDKIQLEGRRHVLPDELPVDARRTFGVERRLESGEQLTVGLMDGNIVASETVIVE